MERPTPLGRTEYPVTGFPVTGFPRDSWSDVLCRVADQPGTRVVDGGSDDGFGDAHGRRRALLAEGGLSASLSAMSSLARSLPEWLGI